MLSLLFSFVFICRFPFLPFTFFTFILLLSVFFFVLMLMVFWRIGNCLCWPSNKTKNLIRHRYICWHFEVNVSASGWRCFWLNLFFPYFLLTPKSAQHFYNNMVCSTFLLFLFSTYYCYYYVSVSKSSCFCYYRKRSLFIK